MAVTLTGRLTRVDVQRVKEPDYNYTHKYSPNTEHYLVRANCCLQTEDGRRYYFDSPAAKMRVANAPGVALVLFDIEGEAAKWWEEVKGCASATAERANTNNVKCLVSVGDTITIRATVKSERPTYTSVNRVRKVGA